MCPASEGASNARSANGMKAIWPISPSSRDIIIQCSKPHSRQRPQRRWRRKASRKKSAGRSSAGRWTAKPGEVGGRQRHEGEEGEAGERHAADQQVDVARGEPRLAGPPAAARRRVHPEEDREEEPRGEPAPGARRGELRGLEALGEERRRRQRVIAVEERRAREGRAEEQEGVARAAVEAQQGDRRHPERQHHRHRLVQRVDVDVADPGQTVHPGRDGQAAEHDRRVGGHPPRGPVGRRDPGRGGWRSSRSTRSVRSLRRATLPLVALHDRELQRPLAVEVERAHVQGERRLHPLVDRAGEQRREALGPGGEALGRDVGEERRAGRRATSGGDSFSPA